MTQEALRPDQQKPADQVRPAAPAKPYAAEEIQDAFRKLEKTRTILHSAGNDEGGQTPHEVLAETRTYKLLHYQQMVNKTANTPVLVVYALINKFYVLDLQQDKSWIKSLLSQGFDVYLIDWKTPTAADKYVSFDDY